MNGRKAKGLRSLAQMISVGKPDRVYGRVMLGESPTGTIALGDCTRKLYKNLKRMSKSGAALVRPETPTQDV